MNIGFGSAMAVIGFLFFVMALVKLITGKDFFVYKFLYAKSERLWKGATNHFYIVVGLLIMVLGILWACGIIWNIG